MSVKELGRPTRPILEWDEVDINDLHKETETEVKAAAKNTSKESKKVESKRGGLFGFLRGGKK